MEEDTAQPPPRSLEVLPVLVVEANQVAEDEGDWRLEWTVVGKSGGGDDEDVEEETE